MQKKTLLILLIALALVGGITWLTLSKSGPRTQPVAMGEHLFPDLPVNDVARIKIAVTGHALSVEKGDSGWVVPSRNNYPADFEKVARFVRQVANMKIGRTFPAGPGDLERLGLNEPGKDSGPKQAGILVSLEKADGTSLASFLVGKDRLSKSQQMKGIPEGQYLRLPGKDTVYLVDGYVAKSDTKDPEWLDKIIVTVKAEDVRAISCRTGAPDFSQEVYAIERPEKGADFAPVVFPTNRKLKAQAANQLAGLLSALSMDDVEKAEGDPADFSDVLLSFTLFDGRVYKIYPERKDPRGTCRVRLDVGFEEPPDATAAPDAADMTATAAADAGSLTPAAQNATAILADRENRRVLPWVFTLAPWRCEKIVTDTSTLMENQEEDKPSPAE